MSQILFTGIKLNELLERIGQLIDSKIGVLPTKKKETQSDYLTRAEASRLLKITLPTLHDWTKLGYLKSYKMGSRVLYKESEIIQTLEQVPSFKYKKGGFSHE
jgi:excisionase family DNA binding protein